MLPELSIHGMELEWNIQFYFNEIFILFTKHSRMFIAIDSFVKHLVYVYYTFAHTLHLDSLQYTVILVTKRLFIACLKIGSFENRMLIARYF